jgi:uncharacterized membrane protein
MPKGFANSAVFWAIASAMVLGLSGPFSKLAINSGASYLGVGIVSGLGIVVVASVGLWSGSAAIYPNLNSVVWAALAGIMAGFGFRWTYKAFSLPGGYVSMVIAITAAYPIITTLIGVAFMGEYEYLILWRIIIGTVLIAAGVFLTATSVGGF